MTAAQEAPQTIPEQAGICEGGCSAPSVLAKEYTSFCSQWDVEMPNMAKTAWLCIWELQEWLDLKYDFDPTINHILPRAHFHSPCLTPSASPLILIY